MPLPASANRPRRLPIAPVNDPRTWPKSSDSSSVDGSAAQFTGTNGSAVHAECAWIARATSSLPVPLSPRMSTVACVEAAWPTSL